MAHAEVTDEGRPLGGEMHDGPWPWLIGFLAPFMAFAAFWIAFEFIDQAEPDRSGGTLWYLITAFIGIITLVGAILLKRDETAWTTGLGGLGALVGGAFLASMAQDSYWHGIDFPLMVFFMPGILIVYAVTFLIMGLRTGPYGAETAAIGLGVSTAGTPLVAAIYMLLTMERQIEEAIAAHEAPFGGLLVAVALLAVLFVARRHSRN